jgi:hypothetical protein
MLKIGAEVQQSLHAPRWRISKACGTQNCVEVAAAGDGTVAVRDSKHPDGALLRYSAAEWRDFIAGAKNGEFDDLVEPDIQPPLAWRRSALE